MYHLHVLCIVHVLSLFVVVQIKYNVKRLELFKIMRYIKCPLLLLLLLLLLLFAASVCKVLAMCFIRKALDWVFTQTELKWLDDIMPEISLREKDDKDKLVEIEMQAEVS